MTTTEIVQRQERYGTASEWSTANTVLLMAEIGWESDTGKGKIGDGVTAWSSLAYNVLPDLPGELAARLANAPAKRTLTADGNFALTDADGLLVVANKATAIVFTMLQNSAMASSWPTDSVVRFINKNDGELTLTPGTGVTFIGDVLTFGKGQGGVLVWDSANTWVCVPFVSGSAPTVTGTTGSPTTGSFTDGGGVTWDFWEFPSSGTLTTDGRIPGKMLLVGGGGGGGGATGGYTGAGGGGGAVVVTPIVLPNGTITITIGGPGAGGGSTGSTGGTSSVTGFDNGVEYRAPGGGGGGAWNGSGLAGGVGAGSGGGGGNGYSAGAATAFNGPVILPYTTGYSGSNAAGGGFGGGGGGAGGAASGTSGGAAKAVTDFATTTLNPGAGGHANGSATSAEYGTGGAGKYSGDYVGYTGTGGVCRICIPRP